MVQVVTRAGGPSIERLAEAEERLRAAVAQLHQMASEVLAVAAESAGAVRGSRLAVRADSPLLLTVDEVAEQLGISVSKAWQLVGAGTIPSCTVGRTRRVRATDLAGYVEGL